MLRDHRKVIRRALFLNLKDDIIKKYIAMTRNEELTLLLEIMRKYDLPVSPSLEFAIRSKMDDSSGDDTFIPVVGSIGSDTDSVPSSETSPIGKPIHHSNVISGENNVALPRLLDTTRKNRKKTILRVTRSDGSTIEDSIAVVTFAQTIQEIGVERVRSLNISLDGMNLILIEENMPYLSQQYSLGGGYCLNSHSSTERKKYHLEKIFKALGLKWKVEIISSER